MNSSDTNLLDIAWIPTTGPEGTEYVTVHDALSRSAEITGLGPTDSPAEMDALLRFLIPLATLVLREGEGVIRANEDASINTVLDRYRDRFNLFDLDRPFAQEWHVTAQQRDAVPHSKRLPMDQLHVHAPGASSAWWNLRPDARNSADLHVLPLLLLAAWYERTNSNTASPPFYNGKRISAAPQAAKAVDWFNRTSFYLLGESLADTLELNIPLHWIDSTDLPTWLDQETQPSPEQIASGQVPLWRYTWTPNRALIFTENGTPTGWVSGLTRRGIPEMGKEKDNAKAIVGADHHALFDESLDKKGNLNRRRLRLEGDLTQTQGLQHWYREKLNRHIIHLAEERQQETRTATGVGVHTDMRDKSNDAKYSSWIEIRLQLLTIPHSDALDALGSIIKACSDWNLNKAVGIALGVDPKRDKSMLDVAQTAIYAALDQEVLPSFTDLAQGQTIDTWQVAQRAMRATNKAFKVVTEPLITPASIPDISNARHLYAASVRTQLQPLRPLNETKEPA